MLSPTSNISAIPSNTAVDDAIFDLEQQISLLDEAIAPLYNKTKKKLNKIENEISNCNFLIDSGLGSNSDQAALRTTKKQLRQSRIKLWEELKVLPALEEQRQEMDRQLFALRRRHGVLDSWHEVHSFFLILILVLTVPSIRVLLVIL